MAIDNNNQYKPLDLEPIRNRLGTFQEMRAAGDCQADDYREYAVDASGDVSNLIAEVVALRELLRETIEAEFDSLKSAVFRPRRDSAWHVVVWEDDIDNPIINTEMIINHPGWKTFDEAKQYADFMLHA